ncbi:MAG: hypothetical protein KGZ79_10355 [Dethiobacter sp.]|nr:hypothetical protein [Dethiobacter sp.]
MTLHEYDIANAIRGMYAACHHMMLRLTEKSWAEMNYKLVAFILLTIIMYYAVFIRPYLFPKILINEELEKIIDSACERGVEYAEQLYKIDLSLERMEISLYLAYYVLRKTKVVPDDYLKMINEIIKDKVQLLLNSKIQTSI